MRLADLAGQDPAIGPLLAGLASGRLAHAYLFDGPVGVGKRSAAIGLGLAIMCPVDPGRGCGRCDTCERALAGNHPDLRVFAPVSSQIVVAEVQEIVALAARRPHEAGARVLIIDQADRMNVTAANCLLKTLEEPHLGTHIILVTAAPDRLLATIQSRVQRVRFVAVSPPILVQIAVARGINPGRAQVAAALAGGGVARMLAMLEAEGETQVWDAVTRLRAAAAGRTMGVIFDAAVVVADKEMRETLPHTLGLLAAFYRDALATAAGVGELVVLGERAGEVGTVAAAAAVYRGFPHLRRALGATVEAIGALDGNANAVTTIERMMIEMRPLEQAVAGAQGRAA